MAMSRGRIEFYKEHYPCGTRVKLDGMGDDPCPVEPGAVGTVIAVDDIGTLHKITEQIEAQEPKMSM